MYLCGLFLLPDLKINSWLRDQLNICEEYQEEEMQDESEAMQSVENATADIM